MSERITIEETEDDHGMPAWRLLNASDVAVGFVGFDRERREWVAVVEGSEVASADTLTDAALKATLHTRWKVLNDGDYEPGYYREYWSKVFSMVPSNQSDGRHTPASTPDDSSTASHSFWSWLKRPFSVLSSRIRVRQVLDSTKSGKPTLL